MTKLCKSIILLCSILLTSCTLNHTLPPDTDTEFLKKAFPNSVSNDFVACQDETGLKFSKNYDKAISCALNVNSLDKDAVKSKATPPKRCFIVKKTSKDIQSTSFFNYIPIPIMRIIMNKDTGEISVEVGVGKALGIYYPDYDTLFVVDNVDKQAILRHELQHVILKKLDIPDDNHQHDIFNICEPAYYTPSDKAKRSHYLRRYTLGIFGNYLVWKKQK